MQPPIQLQVLRVPNLPTCALSRNSYPPSFGSAQDVPKTSHITIDLLLTRLTLGIFLGITAEPLHLNRYTTRLAPGSFAACKLWESQLSCPTHTNKGQSYAHSTREFSVVVDFIVNIHFLYMFMKIE